MERGSLNHDKEFSISLMDIEEAIENTEQQRWLEEIPIAELDSSQEVEEEISELKEDTPNILNLTDKQYNLNAEEYEPLSGNTLLDVMLEDMGELPNRTTKISISSDKSESGIIQVEDFLGLHSLEDTKKYLLRKKEKISEIQLKAELEKVSTNRPSGANLDISKLPNLGERKSGVSEFYRAGVENVWRQDSEYQTAVMKKILEIRGIPQEYLDSYFEYIKSLGGFVNINNDYMKSAFGPSIESFEYGIYNSNGENRYKLRLLLPLKFVNDTIQGFVGYTPAKADEGDTIKYLYPRKEILLKSKILFTNKEIFRKAILDGYLCLTDGLFDTITLNYLGINAASFCGSAITRYHKMLLSVIRTIIIVPDNDRAGNMLASTAKRLFPRVRVIYQDTSKDVDEYLRTLSNQKEFVARFNQWKNVDFLGNMNIKSTLNK